MRYEQALYAITPSLAFFYSLGLVIEENGAHAFHYLARTALRRVILDLANLVAHSVHKQALHGM